MAGSTALRAIIVVLLATAVARADEWPLESIRLKSGAVFRGLVLEETPKKTRFVCVRRVPGRATFCLWTTYTADEIAGIERLAAADRAVLAERIKALDDERSTEAHRLATIELEPTTWRPSGLQYRSERFTLRSDAEEEIVRRTALRLEQVFAAFSRFFPPQHECASTEILLFRTREGYGDFLKAEGRAFANTAFYDPAAHRVACASDLDRLGDDLAKVKQQHLLLRGDLNRQEAALAKLYRGQELLRHVQPIRDTRNRIDAAERQNETAFNRTSRRLFSTLYHEAFHAYLEGCVLPSASTELPRWLNEGLAQIFESAIVEAGELRVGHADAERLEKAKQLARKGGLIPLGDLLKSGPKHFQTFSAANRAESDTYYLTAWAWAHYLTFDRRMATPALGTYLADMRRGGDPRQAFAVLTKIEPAAAERGFGQYLLRLQPDGTLMEPLTGR